MKIKKIFMSCLLLAGVLSASAQEQYPKTVYDHNPYWFVQAQAGAQYTLGEIDFSDLVSPNVQVAFGRQFTPVFGARLAVNAWQSRAGITNNGETGSWHWNYVAPGVDAILNLSNLFAGYNPTRLFSFSVFGGLGANIGWGNDKAGILNKVAVLYPYQQQLYGSATENVAYVWDGTKVRLYGRVGIAGDFRLSESVSVGVEVNANTLSDHYNSKRAGNWDWYFNALAGVKVNLGKTYSTRTIEAPKPLERIIEKQIIHEVEKPCPPAVQPTQATEKKEEVDTRFRRDIFFLIRATQVSKQEQTKVKEVADYLKEHPNATVEVTGYADKGTGNPTINRNLSQCRAQAVANMLTRVYGIKKDRIKVDYKGDTVQPFAKQVDNRVAICIAE